MKARNKALLVICLMLAGVASSFQNCAGYHSGDGGPAELVSGVRGPSMVGSLPSSSDNSSTPLLQTGLCKDSNLIGVWAADPEAALDPSVEVIQVGDNCQAVSRKCGSLISVPAVSLKTGSESAQGVYPVYVVGSNGAEGCLPDGKHDCEYVFNPQGQGESQFSLKCDHDKSVDLVQMTDVEVQEMEKAGALPDMNRDPASEEPTPIPSVSATPIPSVSATPALSSSSSSSVTSSDGSAPPEVTESKDCPTQKGKAYRHRRAHFHREHRRWEWQQWSAWNYSSCGCHFEGQLADSANGNCACPSGKVLKDGKCRSK